MKGHADAGSEGNDIVCAAVSSAGYMAANTITDVIQAQAEVTVDEKGVLYVMVQPRWADQCRAVLEGLRLHMEGLQEQYPRNIQVIYTEV